LVAGSNPAGPTNPSPLLSINHMLARFWAHLMWFAVGVWEYLYDFVHLSGFCGEQLFGLSIDHFTADSIYGCSRP